MRPINRLIPPNSASLQLANVDLKITHMRYLIIYTGLS